jgi:hypothetical protein
MFWGWRRLEWATLATSRSSCLFLMSTEVGQNKAGGREKQKQPKTWKNTTKTPRSTSLSASS